MAAVLEGTARVVGRRLRVTVRLVDVTDGFQLWSERYDRELEDVLVIQDEIAGSVVRSLRVVLSREERRAMRRGRTENPRARSIRTTRWCSTESAATARCSGSPTGP